VKSIRTAGVKVTARTAARERARFLVTASGVKSRPAWPVRAKMGRKATAITMRE
jgi:hypothetical protein